MKTSLKHSKLLFILLRLKNMLQQLFDFSVHSICGRLITGAGTKKVFKSTAKKLKQVLVNGSPFSMPTSLFHRSLYFQHSGFELKQKRACFSFKKFPCCRNIYVCFILFFYMSQELHSSITSTLGFSSRQLFQLFSLI